MKTLYHGTTYDNYQSILKNGFKPSINSAWKCSDSNYMFFWDESEKTRNECFEECIGNILYTAVINDFQGTSFVILELEVPDEICNKDHTVDWDYQKSTAIKVNDLDISMIKNVYINDKAYNKYLRWYYFCNHMRENGCIKEDFLNPELWEALVIMCDTMDYKKKCEILDKNLYNINKYLKVR